MPKARPPFLDFLHRVYKQGFQVGVLACLAATGLWGHKTHWQFSAAHAEASPSHLTASADATFAIRDSDAGGGHSLAPSPEGALGLIKFPTAKSIADLGIAVHTAEHRPLVHVVSAAGTVDYEPSRRAELSVRTTGTVWRIEKHMGESVRAGDVLAIVDAPALGQAKADLLHSIADVLLSQKVYEPLQSFAHGEVPAKQIRSAETDLRKAKVDLFNAHQALISLGLSVDLEELQGLPEAELKMRLKFLGLPASIASRLDPNSTSASLLAVHSPFDGLVISRDLPLGEIVSPARICFEVADVSRMWILLNVREQDGDDLEIGQKVVFAAGKATVTSVITWMSTAVDPKTRTVEVRCEVDNPEVLTEDGQPTGKRLLRANLFGVGKIELASNPLALSVPTKAVQWDGKEHVVFVQADPQSFEPRHVRLGIVTDQFSEVLEGISDSNLVAVEGSHLLKSEMQRSAAAKPP